MPVLCDFVQIVGDSEKRIDKTTGTTEAPLPDFKTLGRAADQSALLMYSVRHVGHDSEIHINGIKAGVITPTSGDTIFFTQLMALPGSALKDGTNEIVLKGVDDPFIIKDLVCFFHKSV
jgi:hypothetical protein